MQIHFLLKRRFRGCCRRSIVNYLSRAEGGGFSPAAMNVTTAYFSRKIEKK